MMNIQLSVITPSLNPRKDYLLRVHEALDQQSLSKDKWEYIMVDSGSHPPLESWVNLNWHPSARIISEPYKSLARSRLRGMMVARGELIVFIDDDNVPAPDYLDNAINLMSQYPHIGAIGGYIEGEFEVPYEDWMKEFLIILCAMQFTDDRKRDLQYAYSCHLAHSSYFPPGAGLVLRRAVVDKYIERVTIDPSLLNLGRVGDSLVGSEDADLVYTATDAGYAIGSSARLRMKHLIPAYRLKKSYLKRLLYASNYGTARLLIIRGMRPQMTPPRKSFWNRIRQWYSYYRPRSNEEECWYAFHKGYADGICGAPYDPRFK